MPPIFDKYYSVLTNGEIEIEIEGPCGRDRSAGIHIPDGVVFGQDNRGNYYLNGIPARIEMRHQHFEFGRRNFEWKNF